MREIVFPEAFQQREIDALKNRVIKKDRAFLLLLGPSSVGKSEIIEELDKITDYDRFRYVKPYTTRELRPNEKSKIHVENDEFTEMHAAGEFIVVNDLYGVRYGTPKETILSALDEGKTPLLDYPLRTVGKLAHPSYDLVSAYIYPPSIEELMARLTSSGRHIDDRAELGVQELEQLIKSGYQHPDLDFSVVSENNRVNKAAQYILKTLEEVTI